MKKLFLVSLLFAFVLNSNAQEKKEKKAKSTTEKSSKSNKEAEVPLKKDGTPDKRYNSTKDNKSNVPLKKDGKAEAKYKKETNSNEKAPKKKDKATGTYKGKTVYTGPRGGEYYINSNGNKTYISD
jgi:colicin import membrane protein